jgi:two-component system cell cycle sensor histidine kinase/response regulator CckA
VETKSGSGADWSTTAPDRWSAEVTSHDARYRSIIETSPDAIVIIDERENIVFVNAIVERILGYPVSELIGRSLTTIIPERMRAAHMQGFQRYLATSKKHLDWRAVDLPALHCDGREIPVSLAFSEFTEGGERFFTGVLRDMTAATAQAVQVQALQEQLRQSQKMEAIGTLAGGIAHDFNNLLTAIGVNAELALADLPKASPIRDDIEEIRKAATRAAGLTRQLLAFSRRQSLELSVLDLNEMVTGAQSLLRRVTPESIEFRLELDPDIPPIRADAGQLELVLMNLVVNARDAMPLGGNLRIGTFAVTVGGNGDAPSHELPQGQYVRLTVSDSGTGMDVTTLERVFEPFFTTKEAGQGTGLGLSTVYGIVKQSGGYVFADSSVGDGSSFTLYFPIVRESASAEASPVHCEVVAMPGGCILLVEDEPQVRAVLRRMLIGEGYQVHEAGNGRDALRVMAEESDRIDLVLSDLVMPYLGGRELAAALGLSHPDTPVLLMSGYDAELFEGSDALHNAIGFIQKPFSGAELTNQIAALIAAKVVT